MHANDNEPRTEYATFCSLMSQLDQALAISRDLRAGSRRLVEELSTPREERDA